MVQYAELLAEGAGVARDPAKAAALLATAHGPQFRADQNYYALALETGKGCRRRPAEGVKCYKIAAENGSLVATRNVGLCYRNGGGVERDLAEAARWFKRAADAVILGRAPTMERRCGPVWALRRTARKRWLISGKALKARTGTAATTWGGCARTAKECQLIARRQSGGTAALPRGLSDLGRMHDEGTGVAQDRTEAAVWYRKAAELGDAAERLARLCRDGRGVAKDVKEAKRLYQKAARRGSAAAAAELAALQRRHSRRSRPSIDQTDSRAARSPRGPRALTGGARQPRKLKRETALA
jgi:TPR repeat protein